MCSFLCYFSFEGKKEEVNYVVKKIRKKCDQRIKKRKEKKRESWIEGGDSARARARARACVYDSNSSTFCCTFGIPVWEKYRYDEEVPVWVSVPCTALLTELIAADFIFPPVRCLFRFRSHSDTRRWQGRLHIQRIFLGNHFDSLVPFSFRLPPTSNWQKSVFCFFLSLFLCCT